MDSGGVVLLEREAQLARLDELLAGAVDGSGAVAVIEGAPGIGKTALLRATGIRAEARACEALSARGRLLEREHPFGIVDQLLGPELVPGERPSRRGGEALFVALQERFGALARRASERPLLVCVDDAQWADSESLRLLDYLSGRIERLAMLLLLAVRPGEAGDSRGLVATLSSGAVVIRPPPLTVSAVAVLVGGGLGAEPDESFAAACAEVTGGNPFLLGELVIAARDEGLDPSRANAARVREMTPDGVARAVLVRMAQVSADARRLAGAVAVLGEPVRLREGAELAGLDLASAARAAELLVAASVIAGREPLEFSHQLVRNAVYADLGLADRQSLHARAARLLDADPDVPGGRVAAQLLALTPAGDSWVARRLASAGEAAFGAGGCDAAVAYLRRALAEPPPASERLVVLSALAQAEAAAGLTEALDHLRQARSLIADPVRRARVSQSLARLFFLRGEFELAGQTAGEALGELGSDDGGPLARQLLADYLAAATYCPALRAGEDPRVLGLLADAQAGRLPAEPQLRAQIAGALALWGTAPRRVRDVALSAIASGPIEAETSEGFASSTVAGALVLIGDYDIAEGVIEQLAARARVSGSIVAQTLADQLMAYIRWHQGRLPAAAEHARAALEPRPFGWGYTMGLAVPTLVLAETHRGRLDAARAALHLADHLKGDRPERALVLYARGQLAIAEGSPERALEDFQTAGRIEQQYGIEKPAVLPWRPAAALAAHTLGDHPLAGELAKTAVAVARLLGTARPVGVALCAAGQVTSSDEGLALLSESVAVLERSQSGLEHARALIALGTALRHARRIADARAALSQGQAIARGCGATPLAAHAHQELRATGARPRKILRSGPDALTPTEHRVAAMAAAGSTNRDIARSLVVSTRTVEAHLAHTYTKLGINSRRQLADMLADQTHASQQP
jgi:DNA-binding CsgD family transcriptional regulator